MSVLYLACIGDRHVDPMFKLFRNPERAGMWTRDTFYQTVAHPRSVAAVEPAPEPYLYLWTYMAESDYAWVQPIQEPDR